MLILFIYVNLLSVFICYKLLVVCTLLVSLFVNFGPIFLCFCPYTVVFVLSVLNIMYLT